VLLVSVWLSMFLDVNHLPLRLLLLTLSFFLLAEGLMFSLLITSSTTVWQKLILDLSNSEMLPSLVSLFIESMFLAFFRVTNELLIFNYNLPCFKCWLWTTNWSLVGSLRLAVLWHFAFVLYFQLLLRFWFFDEFSAIYLVKLFTRLEWADLLSWIIVCTWLFHYPCSRIILPVASIIARLIQSASSSDLTFSFRISFLISTFEFAKDVFELVWIVDMWFNSGHCLIWVKVLGLSVCIRTGSLFRFCHLQVEC